VRATPRPRVLAVLATTVGLAAAGLAVAPAAQAGPPGHWTRLTTSSHISNIDYPGLVRQGSKLQVFWTQNDTGTASSLRVRGVSAAGKADAATHTVVSGWSSLINDPAPILHNGGLLVAFGGIRSTAASEKYSGAMAYATSTNGTAWALGSGALTKTKTAYGSYGTDAVDDAGTPYVAVNAGSSDHVTLHRGIDASFPAAQNDDQTTATGSFAYHAALARDTKTGVIWAAWYSNGTGQEGIWYQQVYPTKGTARRAPGSYSSAGTPAPDQAVAITSRKGGGVWIGYAVGYPFTTKVRVLKAGSSTYRDLAAHDAGAVALSAGVGGRIWAAWEADGKVFAARSTVSVSRFSTKVSAAGPSAKYYGSVYSVAIDGSKGPLDVVVNATVPNKSYQALYHTQLYAPLVVKLSRTSVKSSTGGSVTVTVTDAGAAVAGAKVVFNGVTVKTNSHGKAIVKVKKHASTGKKTLTVSLKYYVTKRLTIRVT
jgi:hypothetical protein